MRTMRQLISALLVALAFLAALPAPAFAGTEGRLVARMNAERSARGLAPLRVYGDLVGDARAHSRRMMEEGRLFHNGNLGAVTTGWEALGENVGVGPSVDAIHEAFMASSSHRRNILGDFNYVGVGVVQEAEDKFWVTVIFMKGPADLLDPAPTTTTTTTTTIPPPTTTVPAATTTTTTPPPATTTTTTPPPATTATPPTSRSAGRIADRGGSSQTDSPVRTDRPPVFRRMRLGGVYVV